MNLKRQTTISLLWNGINKVGYQVIALLVGIITARLLSPTDFGYIAALALFSSLSNILIESGFTSALVRRSNNTNADYSAAFVFNIILSLVFYVILFIVAPDIAAYFNMPPLKNLARILFLTIIFNAFTIIPNIILTKELSFKKIATADLLSMVISGIITIYMALTGWEYWAIAAQQLSQTFSRAVIMWILSHWHLGKEFNFSIMREIFAFSTVLIISSVISNCVKYVYNFFIGPRYSSEDLGYYGQAYKFHQIPPTIISSTLTGVSYPVLSSLNDDKPRQQQYIEQIVRLTAFVTFPVMAGLWVVAPHFISVILTDKWMPMLPYFRLLLIAGTVLPFYNFNLNLLNAVGLPKLNFTNELIRNILILTLLFVFNGTIQEIIFGYLIACFSAYFISVVIIHIKIGYKIFDHMKHILPPLIISLIMDLTIMWLDRAIDCNAGLALLIQIAVGTIVYFGIAYTFKLQILNYLIDNIKNKSFK